MSLIEILPDDAGHDELVSGFDDSGEPIFYILTRDAGVAECDGCRQGTCVQRVEYCDAWGTEGGYVTVHGVEKRLS